MNFKYFNWNYDLSNFIVTLIENFFSEFSIEKKKTIFTMIDDESKKQIHKTKY